MERKIRDIKRKVNTFLVAGWKLEEIADHLGMCKKTLHSYYKMEYTYKVVTMGYKNEPYMTEEEMIQGFQCSYNDLSDSEKEIYENNN
jgi:AraC-like DNA-binding protein